MKQVGPGTDIAGRYRLVSMLGAGGMGSVWRADHLSLRSQVAVKLMDPSFTSTPEAVGRFMREAHAAAALRSPHVAQTFDFGVDDGLPFIVMELLEGESMSSRLERLGRLAPDETSRLFTQIARAVSKAHEAGIVHRDLKPDNIFIVKNDDEELAKVLDFGIAKSMESLGGSMPGFGTRTGAVMGTPHYMSPEQAEGSKGIDHRTDIWSLAVIACECLTGRRPFDAETLGSLILAICSKPMPIPSQLGPVPPGFDAWFARAAHRDPNQRFSTVKEAITELRFVCGSTNSSMPLSSGAMPMSGGTVPLHAVSPAVVTGRTLDPNARSVEETAPKRRSPVIWLGVGALVLAAAGAGYVLTRGGGAESTAAIAETAAPPPTPTAAPGPSVTVQPVEPVGAAADAPPPKPEASQAAPEASAPVKVRAPVAPKQARPASQPKKAASTAAPTRAEPPPAPPATPKVNLGI